MNETSWKIFKSNEETLNSILESCEKAQKTIDLEQFIFIPDNFSNKLIEICSKKAKEGVQIRFLWDAAGSFSFFGTNTIENLKKKGIQLLFFKTLLPSIFEVTNYRSWYFRNHRRTIVIDNKVAFTGSICLCEKMKDWRDTNIKVEGSIVNEMQSAFEKMWNRANKRRYLNKKIKTIKNNYEFSYLTNSPLPKQRKLYNKTIEVIKNSNKYVYIATPYFVPTHRLARALRLASRRGVDIKLMIPEKSDHPVVDIAAGTFFNSMLKSGVKIFLYKDRMLHSKTIVIDDYWSSIGTLNMDHVSLLYNFEANLVSTNRQMADEFKNDFINEIKNCRQITLDEWNNRYWVEKLAGFFIKFIRSFF